MVTDCETKETHAGLVRELFRGVMVGEGGVGVPDFPPGKLNDLEQFLEKRFGGEKSSDELREALERFIAVRIRYWASSRGYLKERTRLWDVEEARAHLLNALAGRRSSDVVALDQKFTNLLSAL